MSQAGGRIASTRTRAGSRRMADQKTEDTKSPLPRRGARPFVGPAGPAPAGAARPFLRPLSTPQRTTAAPFVPPVVAGKPALGGSAPAPAARAPTPVAMPAVAPIDADPAQETRPVTSEMVALDAFDAFDTVWDTQRPHEQPVTMPESQATASPLDELSLGSGTDAHKVWAEEITAAASDVMAGELAPPPAPADEPSYAPPADAIPAWLEDDNPSMPSATIHPVGAPESPAEAPEPPQASPAWPIAENDASYSLAEWTDTHAIPPADSFQPAASESPYPAPVEPSLGEAVSGSPELGPQLERPRFELVSASQETEAVPDARLSHDMRFAAAFDRLADRIRSGEIDVSSIAPDATDAAILASVLAALLGGSSSR